MLPPRRWVKVLRRTGGRGKLGASGATVATDGVINLLAESFATVARAPVRRYVRSVRVELISSAD